MELIKLINVNELIAQLICFLTLFFVMKFMFWSKILAFLESRKQHVVNELNTIEQTKKEVSQLKSEYEGHIEKIEVKATQKIHEAMEEGRKITEEMRKQAHLDAQEIIEKAKTSVNFELRKTQEELKDKLVDIVISATEKMVSERLTEEEDRKMVEKFIDEIETVDDR